jgi:hypothetical protein
MNALPILTEKPQIRFATSGGYSCDITRADFGRLSHEPAPPHESNGVLVPMILPHPSPLPLGEGGFSADSLKRRAVAAVYRFTAQLFSGKSLRAFNLLLPPPLKLRRTSRRQFGNMLALCSLCLRGEIRTMGFSVSKHGTACSRARLCCLHGKIPVSIISRLLTEAFRLVHRQNSNQTTPLTASSTYSTGCDNFGKWNCPKTSRLMGGQLGFPVS